MKIRVLHNLNSGNLYGRKMTITVNVIFITFLFTHLLIMPPHFDDMFCMWKFIMGEASGYTQDYTYVNDLIFWNSFFQWLYSIESNFPWLPVGFVLFSSTSFLIIINSILTLASRKKTPLLVTIVILLVTTAIYSQNLISIHQNRTAFLMCASAILVAYLAVSSESCMNRRTKTLIASFVWFSAGMFFRPEAGIAVLGLGSVFLFLLFDYSLKKTILALSAHSIPVIIFLGFYLYQINNSNAFYYQLEPDVEYQIMDRKNIVPLGSMKTKTDSAKYFGATRWMLGDVRTITPEFLKSIIAKPEKSDKGINSRLIACKEMILNAKNGLIKNFNANLLVLIIISLTLFYLLLVRNYLTAAGGSVLVFIGITMILLSAGIKSYDRVIQPLVFIISVFFIFIIVNQVKVRINQFSIMMLLFILLFSFSVLAYQIKANSLISTELKSAEQTIDRRMKELLKREENRKYVVFTGDFTMFNTGAFKNYNDFQAKQLIVPEIGQYSANESYLKTIGKVTGCNGDDFKCRMQFLKEHQHELIIIGNKRRILLYKHYMMDVYQMDFDFIHSKAELLHGESYFWLP